jgi:Uma2 family endonuclease
MTSDQVVAIPECDKFLFPDVVITCSKLELTKNKQGSDALKNPEIIVEVLSDSIELFDRNEKFEFYQTIDSLREYVLVNTKKNKVEVFKKIAANEWLLKTYLHDDDEVKIDDCRFLMKDLYKNIEKVRT